MTPWSEGDLYGLDLFTRSGWTPEEIAFTLGRTVGEVLQRYEEEQNMNDPEPPINVKAVYEDGTSIALEFIYIGKDADGLDTWKATQEVKPKDGMHITADQLPARTTLAIPLLGVDDEG